MFYRKLYVLMAKDKQDNMWVEGVFQSEHAAAEYQKLSCIHDSKIFVSTMIIVANPDE